jgi:hypothetical protein
MGMICCELRLLYGYMPAGSDKVLGPLHRKLLRFYTILFDEWTGAENEANARWSSSGGQWKRIKDMWICGGGCLCEDGVGIYLSRSVVSWKKENNVIGCVV